MAMRGLNLRRRDVFREGQSVSSWCRRPCLPTLGGNLAVPSFPPLRPPASTFHSSFRSQHPQTRIADFLSVITTFSRRGKTHKSCNFTQHIRHTRKCFKGINNKSCIGLRRPTEAIMKLLDHPNIVRLYETFEEPGLRAT